MNDTKPVLNSTVLNQDCISLFTVTITRHRASTSMYLLTFRVRVTTPPQYRRNAMAHTAGASIFVAGEGSLRRHAQCACAARVRWAWWITAGLCNAFP